MSYQRIATPKAYIDMINPLLENGTITGTDQITGSWNGSSASATDVIQLFDNKPNNTITIGGNGTSTAQTIDIDTNITTDDGLLGETLFVAILGHNLKSADATVTVRTDDSDAYDTASTATHAEIYNASTTSTSGNAVIPASDGWSLFTIFRNTDNRYLRITISSTTDNYDADIKIGCIQIGTTYTFPNAPDLNVKKTFTYDGLKINESLGGQKYAHATHLRGGSWAATGAWSTSSEKYFKSGRKKVDMNFSFISDTDAFPEELYDVTKTRTDESILNRIVFMTNGGMFPFLLQYDNTTTTSDDGFLWCRLANEPSFNQVAYRQYNTQLSFVEEF